MLDLELKRLKEKSDEIRKYQEIIKKTEKQIQEKKVEIEENNISKILKRLLYYHNQGREKKGKTGELHRGIVRRLASRNIPELREALEELELNEQKRDLAKALLNSAELQQEINQESEANNVHVIPDYKTPLMGLTFKDSNPIIAKKLFRFNYHRMKNNPISVESYINESLNYCRDLGDISAEEDIWSSIWSSSVQGGISAKGNINKSIHYSSVQEGVSAKGDIRNSIHESKIHGDVSAEESIWNSIH